MGALDAFFIGLVAGFVIALLVFLRSGRPDEPEPRERGYRGYRGW